MRLLLGAHRARLASRRIEQPRLLLDATAVLDDRDLATCLALNRLTDEADRIDVLDLATRAELPRTGTANRNIYVGAEIAFFHVAIAGPEIAQDRAQFADVGLRLFRR